MTTHQIGNIKIEVKQRGDFVSGIVFYHGCPHVKQVPVYMATIVGQKLWGRGRSPEAAIGDLILTHPQAFGAENA